MTTQIVTTESLVLTRTKTPALPVAPTEYSRQYQDQLNNILRLYFNTLDNFVLQLEATVDPYQDQIDRNQTMIWLNNSGGFFSG
jgi:hypothetical protein